MLQGDTLGEALERFRCLWVWGFAPSPVRPPAMLTAACFEFLMELIIEKLGLFCQ